jgi:hypothetical protein
MIKNVKDILQNATPCNAKPNSVSRGENRGGISIINSKNGKRVEFSKAVSDALGNPEKVNFLFTDDCLIIQASTDNGFILKTSGGRKLAYSSAIVQEITNKFSMDFSERVCISFSDYTEADEESTSTVDFKII